MSSLKLSATDTLILEVKIGYASTDIFKENGKEYCEGCMTYSCGGRRCKCNKFYYCNDKCEENDSNFHYCRAINKRYKEKKEFLLRKVGLQNLGNTCYLSSAPQCLVSIDDLTKFILTDTYLNQINYNNPEGQKAS